MGNFKISFFKGPYGFVSGYANYEDGIFIEDINGKKYFIGIKGVKKIVDCFYEETCRGERAGS